MDSVVKVQWSEILERNEVIKETDESAIHEIWMMELLDGYAVPEFYYVHGNGQGVEIHMEHIVGNTLQEIIEQKMTTWHETLDILDGLCQSLYEIKKDYPTLIFADLKPSNAILNTKKRVILIDLEDVVSVGKQEWGRGTRYYAAPEIQTGYAYKKSDIYSLGKTMEQMDWEVHPLFRLFVVRRCINKEESKRPSLRHVRRRLRAYKKLYHLFYKARRFCRHSVRQFIEIVVCLCILMTGYVIIKFSLGFHTLINMRNLK